MVKFLVSTALASLAFFSVAASALGDDRPSLDERSIFFLQPGSTFTARQDLFIAAGRPATSLDGSEVAPIRNCFLQAYAAGPRDRVMRAGRTLTLKNVNVGPGYFALSVDDGNQNVIAQIGCNFDGRQIPLVGDVRDALCAAFDMDLIDVPVDEVSVHL
jgi:hypothetical protein